MWQDSDPQSEMIGYPASGQVSVFFIDSVAWAVDRGLSGPDRNLISIWRNALQPITQMWYLNTKQVIWLITTVNSCSSDAFPPWQALQQQAHWWLHPSLCWPSQIKTEFPVFKVCAHVTYYLRSVLERVILLVFLNLNLYAFRLGNNNITAVGAKRLAEGLQCNRSLMYLG